MPEDDEAIVSRNQEVPVEYMILQGKHPGGTVFAGALVCLSEKAAQLQSLHSLEPFSHLKLKLLI